MASVETLKIRRNSAKRERDSFQPLMDEAYQYAIPFRRSSRDTGTGEKRVDQVFDHTAIDSAFRFPGKLQQDIWPPGEENFQLEPGPLVFDPAERDRLSKELGKISKVCQAYFDDGEWDLSFHEMGLDLSAGTGAMLMNSTADPDQLWEPIAVSIDEVMFEFGANGKVVGIFWDRRMSYRVLFETWPEGKFSQRLKELHRSQPEAETIVHIDTIHEPPKKAGERRLWSMSVWVDGEEQVSFESFSRTKPWLTPRYFRVPGEGYGRGLVMLAMPTIKTVNTAARIQLMAAAIAMLGIYTAVDDGVFNPDLSTLEPGAFWKVARNGGTMGPSVQRFPDPRLDLSQLVLQDMRGAIKGTMLDQALPLTGEAVKSPTEILERVKRAAADQLGAFGRLVKEIIEPAVRRTIELSYNRGLIGNDIPIDQLLVRLRVKSPIAIAREAARLEKIINWLQIVIAITTATGNPAGANRIAEIDKALVTLGRRLGVDEEFIVSDEKRQQMDKQEEQKQALMAAASVAASAGGAA